MKNSWIFWLILAIVVIPATVSGLFALWPLWLLLFIIWMANKENKNGRRVYTRRNTSGVRSRYLNASDNARVNVFLRRYFRENKELELDNGYSLKLNGRSYLGLGDLNVYDHGTFVSSLPGLETLSNSNYISILNQLLKLSKQGYTVHDNGVIDVEVEEHKEPVKEEVKETPKTDFISQIIKLNEDIPDEEISAGLDETASKLTQIKELEAQFPESHDKLEKLNQYYLPILIRILTQYRQLQNVKSDPSYEETRTKLSRTIKLINEAMTTIISSMTDQDFINLSADISTLEAVLQKDGFINDAKLNLKQDKK